MLNTTSNTAAQSVKFNDIFRSTGVEVNETTIGKVFDESNFAQDWDGIYIKPSILPMGTVTIGMRKLTKPTLLVTTKQSQMAFVLATEKDPVFISPFENPSDENGYLLAYTLMPHVSPEFVYYMCKYDYWNKIINNVGSVEYKENGIVWGVVEGEVSWNHIGKGVLCCGYSENPKECGSFESAFPLTAQMIKDKIGDFILPSLDEQNQLIEAAKGQDAKFAALSASTYNVNDLIDRYMVRCLGKGLFGNSSLGLLRECYVRSARESANPEVERILSSIQFEQDVLSEDELRFLSDYLNDVFLRVISSNGMSYHPSLGFTQPQEVTDFMCKIASFPEDIEVYNPFAGADSYAIALKNPVNGEEIEQITWALGQIRLYATGAAPRTDIALGDSFASMEDGKKYKAIISSPAYMKEKGQRIEDIVEKLYNKLEEGGTLVCLVSSGFLFDRSAISIRKRLIEDKAIKCVITLPSNIFTGTGASQSALVISKGTMNEYVILADASGYTRFAKSVYRQTTFDWEQFLRDMEDDVEDYWDRGSYMVEDCISVPLPYDQIKDFDLTPSKYLVPIPADGIQLSEVAVEVPELRGKDATPNYFITGSSIPASTHRKPFVPSLAGAEKIATAKNQVLLPKEAVIVAIVSGEIRTVYTEDFTEKVAFPGGFIKVLKPIEGISAKYLAAVLSTKTVSDQIKAQCVATVIPRLNRMNLSNIILPKFDTPEDREKLIASVISSEMSELESELQNAYDTQKREIRSTRHAMIQTLSALSSNWEQLKMFSELKGGKIDFTDVVGRINPISVERLMDSIEHAISTLERQVKALRFEKTDWGAETAINPYAFINEYIAKHSTPSVRMENKGKDNVADFPYFDDEGDTKFHHTDAAEVFYAPEKLLERIFNNIVANAKAHGFTSDRLDNEIRFDWMSDEGNIVITIANNGKPLKQGVTGNDVLMSGFTTALNKDAEDGTLHSGQGGYEIKSLMEGLGSVEVISEPEADFPVIYKLTFEKTNFETIELED